MKTITHREMRNNSAAVLRDVAAGQTVQVTNHGQVAALIVPPGLDILEYLASQGQVRRASAPVSSLRAIKRRPATTTSAEIVADVRGRW